jgi:uncharacterized membrane protein affecting hemolysin expression
MLLLSLAIGVVLTRTLLQGSVPAGNSPLPAYRQQAGAEEEENEKKE